MNTRISTSSLTLFTQEDGAKFNTGSIDIFLFLSKNKQSFQCVLRAYPNSSLEDKTGFQGKYMLSAETINTFLAEIKDLLNRYSAPENCFSSFNFKIFDEDNNASDSKISITGIELDGISITKEFLDRKVSIINDMLISAIKPSADTAYRCSIL